MTVNGCKSYHHPQPRVFQMALNWANFETTGGQRMAVNRVIEIGNLTRDEEVNFTTGGMAIGSFSLAVNRKVKKGNEWTDEVNCFDVVVFGKQAQSLQQYLIKGKQVAVDGYLKQDRWKKDGQKFSKVSIVANDIQLLGGKDGQHNGGGYETGYERDDYGYSD